VRRAEQVVDLGVLDEDAPKTPDGLRVDVSGIRAGVVNVDVPTVAAVQRNSRRFTGRRPRSSWVALYSRHKRIR
jgi:hypothetical protein